MDKMNWTKRRMWDMKQIQLNGRKKMWDSSCRLPGEISKYTMTRERQDWYQDEDCDLEKYQQELFNTRLRTKEWVVGFGGTVLRKAYKKSKYAFASSW